MYIHTAHGCWHGHRRALSGHGTVPMAGVQPSIQLHVSKVEDEAGALQFIITRTGSSLPLFMDRLAFPPMATSMQVMVLGPLCKVTPPADSIEPPEQGCPLVQRVAPELKGSQADARRVFSAKRELFHTSPKEFDVAPAKLERTKPDRVDPVAGVAADLSRDFDPVFKWVVRVAVTLTGREAGGRPRARRVMVLGAKVVWVPPGHRGGAFGRGGVRAFMNSVVEFPSFCKDHCLLKVTAAAGAPAGAGTPADVPAGVSPAHPNIPAFFVEIGLEDPMVPVGALARTLTSVCALPIIAATKKGFGSVNASLVDDQYVVCRGFEPDKAEAADLRLPQWFVDKAAAVAADPDAAFGRMPRIDVRDVKTLDA